MRQLSELDASFLYLESETTPMHIGGIYLFDASEREKPLAFSTFVAYLRSRLHVVPVFRQRLKEIPCAWAAPTGLMTPISASSATLPTLIWANTAARQA